MSEHSTDSSSKTGSGFGAYWRTWIFLLVLTLIMVIVDQTSLPRAVLLLILLSAMLMKATLIAGNFMHLRYEKLSVAITVAVSLLLTGAILFLLIAPDGIRSLRMGN